MDKIFTIFFILLSSLLYCVESSENCDMHFDIEKSYSITKVQAFDAGTIIYFYFDGRLYQAIEVLSKPNGLFLSRPTWCEKCMNEHFDCQKELE